jgi:hypothetical protein
MSGQHAFLPPSGAAIWVKCAAAPTMWRRYPEASDKVEAIEGEGAHWACEEMQAGRVIDVGLVAPNGVVLTEEMVEGAELYFGEILDVLARYAAFPRPTLQVEQRVTMPSIHPENWGTPDTWFWVDKAKHLYLFDYKFGHDYVDEYENWQLMDYASGILDMLGIDGHEDQRTTVTLTIVQPRCFGHGDPVRRLTVRASELRASFNILRMAAEAATAPNPVATVNAKCKHCAGRHACEVLQRSAYEGMALSKVSVPVDLPAPALGLELAMLKRAMEAMKARVSGLEESVFAAVQRGERVPGWFVEYSSGRQIFNRPASEVIALGELMGIPLGKQATVTPKQAIKLGIPESIITAVSEVPRGAPKLVADNLTAMRKVFSK